MSIAMIVILGLLFLTFVAVVTVLVIVVRIFKMHDIRNEDGQYAWMVPGSWVKIQENLIKTQELMAGSLTELTVHNQQISRLLSTQTDTVLSMFEELKKIKGGKPDGG